MLSITMYLKTQRIMCIELDEPLGLGPGLDREDLLREMNGHVIGQGDIVPIYERFGNE